MSETTMIRKGVDMHRRPLDACHGGKGALDFLEVFGRPDPARRLRFLHDNVMAPGVSIGVHAHSKDEEYYYILSGSGTMTLDGQRIKVQAGDVTGVYPGGSHGLENDSDQNMRLIVFSVAVQ